MLSRAHRYSLVLSAKYRRTFLYRCSHALIATHSSYPLNTGARWLSGRLNTTCILYPIASLGACRVYSFSDGRVIVRQAPLTPNPSPHEKWGERSTKKRRLGTPQAPAGEFPCTPA